MGTIVASTILNKAATQLLDSGNTRWTRSELLGWLNDGQRQIALMSPQSVNKVSVVKLSAGTRQQIPTDGWTLLDIYRYMGTDGLKAGRAIRLVSRELLDGFNPNWHGASPKDTPQNYLFDPQDQTSFYVYPPNTGRGYAEINYALVPQDLASENAPITVNDVFQTSLLDYILFRANSKDAEYAPGIQLAASYWTAFTAALDSRKAAEKDNNPNQGLQPTKPQTSGGES